MGLANALKVPFGLLIDVNNIIEEDGISVRLGCTEPPDNKEEESPLPILDFTRILARAALREACRE